MAQIIITDQEVYNTIREHGLVDTKMSRMVIKNMLERAKEPGVTPEDVKSAFKKLKEMGHFNKK